MGKEHFIWERMKDHAEHHMVTTHYQTIIEIAGERRVLIENHMGVVTYGKERIVIKVKYGHISVCGYGLEILCMSKEQIVILGDIQSVSLQRRGQQ